MNLTGLTLYERSQYQKVTYILFYLCRINYIDGKKTKKQNYRDGKQGLCVGREWDCKETAQGFWGDRTTLYPDCGGDYTD